MKTKSRWSTERRSVQVVVDMLPCQAETSRPRTRSPLEGGMVTCAGALEATSVDAIEPAASPMAQRRSLFCGCSLFIRMTSHNYVVALYGDVAGSCERKRLRPAEPRALDLAAPLGDERAGAEQEQRDARRFGDRREDRQTS